MDEGLYDGPFNSRMVIGGPRASNHKRIEIAEVALEEIKLMILYNL